MSFCHNRGIVHRDLKLENVLFKNTEEMIIKIVDFGIAGVCAGNKKDKVDAGSIAYMPPEVQVYSYHHLYRILKHNVKLHLRLTYGQLV
jgi:serine/threonine protein kinase